MPVACFAEPDLTGLLAAYPLNFEKFTFQG